MIFVIYYLFIIYYLLLRFKVPVPADTFLQMVSTWDCHPPMPRQPLFPDTYS